MTSKKDLKLAIETWFVEHPRPRAVKALRERCLYLERMVKELSLQAYQLGFIQGRKSQ